jgi:hypothetical protein
LADPSSGWSLELQTVAAATAQSSQLDRLAYEGAAMSEDTAAAPIEAERLGPGQFLLDAELLRCGIAFSIEGRTFTVVSQPVALTKMNYLVTVRETHGPDAGRQLRVQLRLGRRGSGPEEPA